MATEKINRGFFHRVPTDMQATLEKDKDLMKLWRGLTPLARNEWVCYVTIVKKAETREDHLERLIQDLRGGKKRPCCWPGCPHRRPNAQKWFTPKKIKVSKKMA